MENTKILLEEMIEYISKTLRVGNKESAYELLFLYRSVLEQYLPTLFSDVNLASSENLLNSLSEVNDLQIKSFEVPVFCSSRGELIYENSELEKRRQAGEYLRTEQELGSGVKFWNLKNALKLSDFQEADRLAKEIVYYEESQQKTFFDSQEYQERSRDYIWQYWLGVFSDISKNLQHYLFNNADKLANEAISAKMMDSTQYEKVKEKYKRKFEKEQKEQQEEEERMQYQKFWKEHGEERMSYINEIDKRGITSFYHFTRLKNLESILKYGVLSRGDLNYHSLPYVFNDKERLDHYLYGVSLSVSSPNKKLLYKFKQQYGGTWVLLSISPEVFKSMYVKELYFFPTNAAKDCGKNRCTFIEMFGTSTNAFPRDNQAEILVFGRILPQYISVIYVESRDDLEKVFEKVDINNKEIVINRNLFNTY